MIATLVFNSVAEAREESINIFGSTKFDKDSNNQNIELKLCRDTINSCLGFTDSRFDIMFAICLSTHSQTSPRNIVNNP